jgi:glyoxylase-like metal-dependent hydrolase (beta-lactamase superfamily II)
VASTPTSPAEAPAPQALRDAGIHRIALPTPFAVGRVNAYLIEDDPLTLIDAGPNSADTLVTLERGLLSAGHRVEDVGLILITHQHMDHFGLVHILARRSGAKVAAIAELAAWLDEFPASMDADDDYAAQIMAANGVPPDMRSVLRAVAKTFHGWGARTQVTACLADGDELELRDRTLTVTRRPGHSPSDTVFHDRERGVLFTGDHLIGHISSNPVITRPLTGPVEPRPQALVDYISSLERTRDMSANLVLPGHGDPIPDHPSLVTRRLALHEKRRARLESLIGDRPRSAFDLALEMWGNVAVTQAYLTISEVLGHVDLLLNAGQVEPFEDSAGVTRFRAV